AIQLLLRAPHSLSSRRIETDSHAFLLLHEKSVNSPLTIRANFDKERRRTSCSSLREAERPYASRPPGAFPRTNPGLGRRPPCAHRTLARPAFGLRARAARVGLAPYRCSPVAWAPGTSGRRLSSPAADP